MILQSAPFSLLSSMRHPRRLSRERIVEFQNRQLRRLIFHAYKNVPYYRSLLKRACIKPQDIETIADLHSIPITSKKDLQSCPPEKIVSQSVNHKYLITHKTSGSTGEPTVVRRTWFEECLLNIFYYRAMHSFGLRMTDKIATVVRKKPIPPRNYQVPKKVLNAFRLYRHITIDCLQAPEHIFRLLRHLNPDILSGFPGALSQIAEVIGDSGTIQPRFVVTGGEVLNLAMRRLISSTFGVPLFDTYRCHECNVIGWECLQTGEYHTCDDGVIVEILNNGRSSQQGERGEVVITNLHSFAMPFIRYRLGDIVKKGLETCHCGLPFSTIKEIQGRMIDYFILPSGRLLHPYEIVGNILHDHFSWISKYQLIQETAYKIILKVVPSRIPKPQMLAQIKKSATAILEGDVDFQIIPVSELKQEPSGKYRVSFSSIKSRYD